jgi:hypothetical protein
VHKAELYAKYRVPFYSIIDPAERTLEAFQVESERWTLIGSFDATRPARVAPFDAIEIEIARLFPPVGWLRG